MTQEKQPDPLSNIDAIQGSSSLYISYEEINSRFSKTQYIIKKYGFDAFITFDPNLLFYFTGHKISSGALYINVALSKSMLFIDGRYFEAVHSHFSKIKLDFIEIVFVPVSAMVGVIYAIKEEMQQIREKQLPVVRYAFDPNNISYKQAVHLQHAFDEIQHTVASSAFSKIELVPHEELFHSIRRQKSEYEIHLIERACQLCEKGFYYILPLLKKNITEEEIAKKLVTYWYGQGADGVSFDPIIAFGRNSALPHWRSSCSSYLNEGDIILIDIGVTIQGYNSDMTRTFSFGDPTVSEFDSWFYAVIESLKKAEEVCKAGQSPADVDKQTRDILQQYNLDGFFLHGLGHGVGLQIHEAPRLSSKAILEQAPLQLHETITLEPGVYFTGKGGVRLENTYVIQQKGVRSLMQSEILPRHEEYIKKYC